MITIKMPEDSSEVSRTLWSF